MSDDDNEWTVASDKSGNTINAPHDYIVFDDVVKARYVRITNVHTPSGLFSISGLRVFGINRNVEPPSEAQILIVKRDSTDKRSVTLMWNSANGASGYNIRYGYAPNKMYLNYEVPGGNIRKVRINSLNANEDYYFSIDTWNDGGTTKGSKVKSTKTDITGINDVQTAPSHAKSIYDIHGSRQQASLANLPFGVYIVDGMKVIKH